MIAKSSFLHFAAAVVALAMLGAVDSQPEAATVARQFGAGFVRQPTRPDGSYAVDHSSQTYLVDREGQLVDMLPRGTPPEKLAAAVRKPL